MRFHFLTEIEVRFLFFVFFGLSWPMMEHMECVLNNSSGLRTQWWEFGDLEVPKSETLSFLDSFCKMMEK